MKFRQIFAPVLLTALAPLAISCGDASDDLDLLQSALRPEAPRQHPRAVTLAQQRPIPPRLEVGFPARDLSGVMLLERERAGVQTWLSADGASISLQAGLLTTTKGFGSGLAGSDVADIAKILRSGRGGYGERVHSFLNGNDQIELRAYKCELGLVDQEILFFKGQAVTAEKVSEHCYGVTEKF